MTPIFAGAFADALSLWRRERDLLLRLAGVFFFLPALALELFLPDQPTFGANSAEAMQQFNAWARLVWPWFLIGYVVQLIGFASIFLLLAQREESTVADLLKRATAAFPRLLLAVLVLVGLTLGLVLIVGGLFLGVGATTLSSVLIVPIFYMFGRTFLLTIVAALEAPATPVAALRRALALSSKRGWLFFGITVLIYLPGQVLVGLIESFKVAVGGDAGSVLVNAVAGLAMATAAAAVGLAFALLKFAVYRRLVASSRGM